MPTLTHSERKSSESFPERQLARRDAAREMRLELRAAALKERMRRRRRSDVTPSGNGSPPAKQKPPLKVPTAAKQIIEQACTAFGASSEMIALRSQDAVTVAAKRLAAKHLAQCGYSTTQIGRFLGGMHHSSVLYLLGGTKPSRLAQPRLQANHYQGPIDYQAWDEWI